jgi:hypothetical protein
VEEIYKNYWKIKSYSDEIPSKIFVLASSGDPYYEANNPSAPQLNLYFSELKNGSKVLDIGAGDMHIEMALKIKRNRSKIF